VEQPEVGAVEIDGDQLLVTLPDSYAGGLDFTYTISDESGVESTATVNLVSVNVLGVVSELVETQTSVGSAGEAFARVTSVFGGLVDVRLSAVQLSALATVPVLLGLLVLILRRREYLVSVSTVAWPQSVNMETEAGAVMLRHDALAWSARKTRKGSTGSRQTQVTLQSGERGWIDSGLLKDTGY